MVLFSGLACAQEPNSSLFSSQNKMVKIYGSGGLAGFENYQTGFFISADGSILTAASSVLDSEPIVCILNNGQHFEAVLKGIDPVRELAILNIDAKNQPFWTLDKNAPMPNPGDLIFALSNLYGAATGSESVSVQRGCVSAITALQARRGAFIAGYKGPVILIDAITNNPGAVGGALIDSDGALLGIIGKQLRSTEQQVWLNYVLPQAQAAQAVEQILSGKGKIANYGQNGQDEPLPDLYWTVDLLGIQLVPDVLPQTLPYVDSVSVVTNPNDKLFQPDDLILAVNGTVVRSIDQLISALRRIDTADKLEFLVQRGEELVFVVQNVIEK